MYLNVIYLNITKTLFYQKKISLFLGRTHVGFTNNYLRSTNNHISSPNFIEQGIKLFDLIFGQVRKQCVDLLFALVHCR